MFKKPAFYLILGASLLIVGVATQKIAGSYYASQAYFVKLVENHLEKEISLLEYQMIPVLDNAATADILKFKDLLLDRNFQYFIYRNNELVFWSDNKFVPDNDSIKGDFAIKLINLNNSLFVVRKWFAGSATGKVEVVSLLPVYINYSVQNKYLNDYFNNKLFSHQLVQVLDKKSADSIAVTLRGNTIFWLEIAAGFSIKDTLFGILLTIIYSLAILLGIVAFLMWTISQAKSRGNWIIIAGLMAIWAGLKLILSGLEFPAVFLSLDLLDSRFFTVSWVEQSFADMMLNTIMIFLISVFAFKFYRHIKMEFLSSKKQRLLYGLVMSFLLIMIINYQYIQLRTIYFNSQITLDITQSLVFNSFRIFSVLVFILVSTSTALLFHLVFKRFDLLVTKNSEKIISLCLGSVMFLFFTLLVNLPMANLLVVTLSISLVLLLTNIHRSLQQLSSAITLYILFWIVIEAVIGGWCITSFEQTRETNKMVRYAQNLAAKNDYMAEFMINQVIKSIQNDPSISARLSNPFLSKDYIIKKISRGYLSKYLDKYNTSIYLYVHSGEGIPGFGTTLNYFDIKSRYTFESNKTEFDGLYILNQDIANLSKHYMAFVPLMRYGNIIGYIILDFKQKRLVPQNVFPELLVDSRFKSYQSAEYSYAIFEDGLLIQSSGDMDYSFIDINIMKDNALTTQNGYKHYLLTDNEGDTVIVSKRNMFWQQLISNSSFLLTVLILPIIILLAIYLFYQVRKGQQISYIAKIQLFLNLAFFVPLVLVTITILSFITNSYKATLIKGKLEEALRLAEQIEKETDAFLVDISAKELLTEKLKELADYGHFDATVYGSDGVLITTTQPTIFSSGLQSTYLNATAYSNIIEQHEVSANETEFVGNLSYYTSYAAIKSPETNRLLGVLAMPFFRAETTIESYQIEALTTILNLFIFIFVLALLATFKTSKWLTAPLLLIRQKLGQTSFSKENKPIEWNSDDEIGKLISEYNNMLVKLEASKEALARSQKESAWREVAQQVAHEIKNPLTPMKLTLQKLDRAVSHSDPSSFVEFGKTVKNLLNQLQMLNDIVTSFSEFAKMPIPKKEKMNLAELLRELNTFFDNDKVINLELQLHQENVFISADYKLMNRIISNIIINAGQSRKADQEIINVTIKTAYVPGNNAVQISITDNGTGIRSDVVDRVFIPRFSTKEKGSGIGLAVAKHGIEHAGGTIWFETEWGKGTTFYMQLPEIE